MKPHTLISIVFVLARAGFQSPMHSAEVFLLDDKKVEGEITGLTEDTLTIKTAQGEQRLRIEDVLRVAFSTKPWPDSPNSRQSIAVYLTDGSCLRCVRLSFKDQVAEIVLFSSGKKVSVPGASLFAFHRGLAPSTDFEKAMKNSGRSTDLLFVRKEDAIHTLEGAVLESDGKRLKFQWDEGEQSVDMSKIEGAIFFRLGSKPGDVLGELTDKYNNRWRVLKAEIKKGIIDLKIVVGAVVSMPISSVREIDFSSGKVVHLSDLKPVSVQQTPYFDIVWNYRKDENFRGTQLRLGGNEFQQGLCLHSRSRLSYSLNGEYHWLRTVVGIDDGTRGRGHVECEILADGKSLFRSELSGVSSPHELRLDVSGAKRLTLFVDFGRNMDSCDWVTFGDAKLIR